MRNTTVLRCLAPLILLTAASSLHAAILLQENFNNLATATPPTNWVIVNNSDGGGSTSWFQGDPGFKNAFNGTIDSYIAANFNNTTFGGAISDWLIMPELSLNNGDTISFYTFSDQFVPDSLELRLSLSGSSIDVGSAASSVGVFTKLAVAINPTYTATGYPSDWTAYSYTVDTAILSSGNPIDGRFAFRYIADDTRVHADYIGLDAVTVQTAVQTGTTPEPASVLLVITAFTGLYFIRKKS